MKIPAFLLLIAITILYHYPLSLSTVYAEPLDITPQPQYGDDINISTPISDKSDVERAKIGPKQNELKFPELSKEETFYSNTQGMFEALPQDLTQDLKFTDPTLQEIEKDFKGQITHPTCGEAKLIREYATKRGRGTSQTERVSINPNPVEFTPTQDFFQTILRTRFWQSIFVPQKGSNLDFSLSNPGQPSITSAAPCNPDLAGKTAEVLQIANDPPQPLLGGLLGIIQSFFDFLKKIIEGGGSGNIRLEAKLEQVKYLPGEMVFADQTVGNAGFLNFIRPESASFSNQGNEEEQVSYVVLKDNREVGVTYEGMASFKSGTLDLVKSLYPEGMAPTSLASVAPVSAPGSIPSGPLAQNLPAPKSQKLIDLIKQAATSFNVPVPVLAAVTWVEGAGMWSYADEEIERYSAPGAKSPLNPEPNGCTAAGPMQFIIGGYARDCGPLYTGKTLKSIWDGYKDAVNEATGENRTPDYRNIKDSIYAAAKKLRGGSGMGNNPNWDEQAVKRAVRSWYGSCDPDSTTEGRFGKGKGFCDFVWGIVVQSSGPF